MAETKSFTDLLLKIVDNRGRTCPLSESGFPLIATNCIKNDALYPLFENIRFVDDETRAEWFRGHPEPGDIIFVCKGSPGRVAIVPDPVSFCIAQDMVAVRADPKKVDPKFLFAVLRSTFVQTQISNMHVGSLIPHFKKGDFQNLRIPMLPMEEQHVIGGMYFDISEKIESNRRLCDLLIQLARTMLMSGTNKTRLGDIATCEKGLSYKGKGLEEDSNLGLPMINLGNFGVDGWLNPQKLKHYSEDYKEKHLLETGDLVVANTDLTQQRVIIGRPALVPPSLGKVLFTHHVTAIKPLKDRELILPLWAQLNSPAFRERAEGFATGTTVAGLPMEALTDFEVWLPDSVLIKEAGQLLSRVWSAEAEDKRLVSLRDMLLPEMLSGRLRVKDAESIVENV